MTGIRTVKLWSSELEMELDVSLSPKFWQWYDGKRRRYLKKHAKLSEQERLNLAYADFMGDS